jgi:hypothetical protein
MVQYVRPVVEQHMQTNRAVAAYEFYSEYPALAVVQKFDNGTQLDFRTTVNSVANQLISSGRQFKDTKEYYKVLADETSKALKSNGIVVDITKKSTTPVTTPPAPVVAPPVEQPPAVTTAPVEQKPVEQKPVETKAKPPGSTSPSAITIEPNVKLKGIAATLV